MEMLKWHGMRAIVTLKKPSSPRPRVQVGRINGSPQKKVNKLQKELGNIALPSEYLSENRDEN